LQNLATSLGNSANDIAVTVTGRNVNGVLHDAVITQCTNTDSSDDSAADRGCDSICTGACTGMSLVPITYSGYIIDNECYDRVLAGGSAPDGSNIVSDPAAHQAKCLLLDGTGGTPPCEPNGYYLAMDCGGGNYHKKFSLVDPVSHANAVAYIQTLGNNDNDLKVTVHGFNDHGTLKDAVFTACTGMDCDGVCTPVNAMDSCMGVMDDVCADNTVTYSGYIIDWYCYGQILMGENTPDNSDVIASPADHSVGCLVGPPECHESGYYLAQRTADGTYHPKYDLRHASTRATVLTFLQNLATSLGNSANNIAVTVTGRNVNGVLHDAVITQCTNTDSSDDSAADRGCDSICTGACSGMSLWPTTTTSMGGDMMDDGMRGPASSGRMSTLPECLAVLIALTMIAK